VRWRLGRSSYPTRDGETVFELAYRARNLLRGGRFSLTCNISSIRADAFPIPTILLIGLRTTIAF
jgi:hypothetical protein